MGRLLSWVFGVMEWNAVNRRRKILCCLAAAGLILASYRLIQWYLDARYAVNIAGVARIADGMSEAQVEDLLGRPGDYHSQVKRTLAKGETLELEGKEFAGPCAVQATIVDWVPRQGPYVRVAFNDQGRAFSKAVVGYQGDGNSDYLRRARKWVLGY